MKLIETREVGIGRMLVRCDIARKMVKAIGDHKTLKALRRAAPTKFVELKTTHITLDSSRLHEVSPFDGNNFILGWDK